ncbi:Glycosyltransferase involved in cell wall bisynthesis [Thiohalospira halophila DSM 15071]|uniref:Glycosyltransferase involved in cell wall bisynthesis n=1 Tax=Thiohalospira halophila DSM 15071 TaxID=1123397 RepID=A0A1I1NGH8_9GAMM|nr:glycosyltransferase family 4 protein [Thiohalospira halophila]SFC96595.1 Glycosyltransferase involved in cell wall bisynthesis [Thiohalospira halophila DSM 15071]
MKIFFYIHSLTGGGAERVTASLVRHLADQGHEVGVITMTSEERDFYPLDPRVRRVTLDLAGVNRGLGKLTANYRRWRALRRALKAEQPDVVVAMMNTSIVLAILAAIGLPVRVYGSERNYPGRQRIGSAWALLRRLVYRFAAGHVAQTREAAAWLVRHAGARNVHVIPNPVVWPIASFPPEVAPESVISPERKVILAVGSKPVQKGFDLLVRALAGLAADRPEWDLVILGVDPESDAVCGGDASIQRLAEGEGVAGRFHLPGRVGNVADWYKRANIFVLSSRYEGFPNVLLEAMASGCPSIAFDCDTGPRDVIEDGANGLLVPAEDFEGLRAAMACLTADEGLRQRFGEQAVAVREKFAEKKVMALWQDLF